MTYRILHECFPNNEIRLTMTRVVVRRSPDDDDASTNELSEHGSDCRSASEVWEDGNDRDTLDISSEFKRPGYGRLGKRTRFGLNARRKLLRAGGAADKVAPNRREWVFLTGTQPSGTLESFRALAEWSGYLVNGLKAWIGWHAKNTFSFYVWEFQKRGALHLHYAVHIPDRKARQYIIDNFKNEWKKLLDNVQEKSGVDMWKRADGSYHRKGWGVLQAYAQTVRKSVAAYLAGYCSDRSNKHNIDGKFDYYPSRWWGVSRPLNAELEAQTIRICKEIPSFNGARIQMSDMRAKLEDSCRKVHYYPHKVGVGETVVAYPHPDNLSQTWSNLWGHLKASMTGINVQSSTALVREYLRIYPTLLLRYSSLDGKALSNLKESYQRFLGSSISQSWVLNFGAISDLALLCSAFTLDSLVQPYHRLIQKMCSKLVTTWILECRRWSQSAKSWVGLTSRDITSLPSLSRAKLRRTPPIYRRGRATLTPFSRLARKVRRAGGVSFFRENVFPKRTFVVPPGGRQLTLGVENARLKRLSPVS